MALVRKMSRGLWLGLAALYALGVLYVSTVVSIVGFRPASFDLAEGWRRFETVRYINHGSDQRADWTANLLMIVPLSFMVTAALWPRQSRAWRLPAALAALLLVVSYVLAVKFIQLWFPRTVTINYIAAQSIGAAIGVLVYGFGHERLRRAVGHLHLGGRSGLVVTLVLATIAAVAFTLVPFDIVISPEDVASRMARLPQVLVGVPGSGRSAGVRAVLLLGAIGLTVPMGMLLEILRPDRPMVLIVPTALLAMTALLVPSLFIISTNPALVTIPMHAIGFVVGVFAMRWLGRQDIAGLRPWLPRAGWIAIPPYVLVVAITSGLASGGWRTLSAALAERMDPNRLLPLWTYYNISKAQAVLSLATHVAMYAPVGMLLWAIAGSERWRGGQAFIIGLLLAGTIEMARWLHPGLVPDVNNLVVGALSAAFGVKLAPFLWKLLEDIAAERAAPAPRRGLGRYL
jgi:VanZ family protein